MKLKHITLIGSLFPILFSLVLFFGVLISADSDDENSNFSSGITGMNLSAEVLKHQPMVEKYARENGISEYVNVLLAIIQVESGGTAEDVMQSSESLGLPPNSLDTESSIKQGCKYFASLLSSCKNQGIDDLNVAIQSYNYGGGYVGYVAGNGKKHTYNLAESFAREKSGGKKVTYTNPIAVAKNGGWRYGYGNMFYVEVVNQYLAVPQVSGELAQKVMNEALKYQGWKYVYGGSNPNTSFDCSGLTQWCYGKAGISLPRTAQAQYDATQHLPLSQARAGDLVFFHSTYNAGSYVTHVGILISPTQMYHAGNPIGYADLVEQMLYYARSENTEKDYFVKQLQLDEVIHNVILKFRHSLMERKTIINIHDIENVIYTDEKWLTFILSQIVQNAIKYFDKQENKLTIYSQDNGTNILLVIEDNGCGIKASDLSRVFEKGFTGSNRNKANATGMGLYLSKKLCDRLGLKLDIASTEKEYTRLTITFPKGIVHNFSE